MLSTNSGGGHKVSKNRNVLLVTKRTAQKTAILSYFYYGLIEVCATNVFIDFTFLEQWLCHAKFCSQINHVTDRSSSLNKNCFSAFNAYILKTKFPSSVFQISRRFY